ncbi:MAG: signal recognition particle receptor subunit alpha, partial [Rickettsiales bacterium]|nr:signal recognition particle receptor subunit alpha [Rickettsiales bacterium]
MFESLSKKLVRAFESLGSRGKITEGDVDEALREIKIALLEADVSFGLVKEMLARIGEQAVGQKIIADVSPANQIVKIVNDELVKALGPEDAGLRLEGKKP